MSRRTNRAHRGQPQGKGGQGGPAKSRGRLEGSRVSPVSLMTPLILRMVLGGRYCYSHDETEPDSSARISIRSA